MTTKLIYFFQISLFTFVFTLILSFHTVIIDASAILEEKNSSTLQRIQERSNVLIAGVRYDSPPFGFRNDEGQIQGFDIDLIHAIAEQWNVEVVLERVTSADRIEKLSSGQVDLIAATLTHTKQRDEQIDFSQTYFMDGQNILVHMDSNIQTIEDLEGKKIAAVSGSTSLVQIQDHAEFHKIGINIIEFSEYTDAIKPLLDGTIAALTTDRGILSHFVQLYPTKLKIMPAHNFSQEPYGIGVPTNDSNFRKLINQTLQNLKLNGQYDAIYRKWFPSAKPYSIEILSAQWMETLSLNIEDSTYTTTPSRLDTILERDRLIVGIASSAVPFSFLTIHQNPVGFNVDLMREFAARWLGNERAIQFVSLLADEGVTKLREGDIDLLAMPLPYSRKHNAYMDFSQIYFVDRRVSLISQNEIDKVEINESFLTYSSVEMALPEFKIIAEQPYSLMLPNRDSKLRDSVNYTLQEIESDGTYGLLYERWFGTAAPDIIENWTEQSPLNEMPKVLRSNEVDVAPLAISEGNLSFFAHKYYGHMGLAPLIYRANLDETLCTLNVEDSILRMPDLGIILPDDRLQLEFD